jgi:hypothetical protein
LSKSVGVFVRPAGSLRSLVEVTARGDETECGSSRVEMEKRMPLIQVVLTLIVVGVLLWLVNRFIPMASTIKSILNAVVVIGVVVWLLNVFGLFQSLSRIRVG